MDRPGEVREPWVVHPSGPRGIERSTGDATPGVPAGFPAFGMKQVAAITGVPAATIRAWERRHGFPVPTRTPTGQRLYTADQVQQLLRLKELVASGVRLRQGIAIVTREGDADGPPAPASPPGSALQPTSVPTRADAHLALEALGAGAAVRDRHGRILAASPRYLALSGRPEAELLGRRAPFPFAPSCDDEADGWARSLWSGEACEARALVRPPGGPPQPVHLHVRARRDAQGAPDGSVEVVIPAAAPPMSGEEAAAAALWRSVVDRGPTAFALLDESLRFQLVNASLADLDGASPAAHVGRTPAELAPCAVAALEPAMRRALATGRPVRGVWLGEDGSEDAGRRWIGEAHPARDQAGRVVGVAVAVADATARARAEDELQGSERRLRRAIAERQALRRVATAASAGADDVHALAVREIALVMDVDLAVLARSEGGETRAVAVWSGAGEPAPVHPGDLVARTAGDLDPERMLGVAGAVSAPVRAWGREWGVVLVGDRRGGPAAGARRRLGELVDLTAAAIAGGAAGAVRADPAIPTPGDDLAVVRALADATRALLRMSDPRQAGAILEEFVRAVGGTVGPPDAADERAMPADLTFGERAPLVPWAEPVSVARMHLERTLPVLLEDARCAVDRLRRASR